MVRKVGREPSLFATDPFGLVMKTPVRWKRNKTKPITVRDTIARIVRPRAAPEVMVKVKRGGKSIEHVIAHLDYITRNGQLDAETERGEIVRGKAHVRAIVKEWTSDAESVKPGARSTINTILSMPPGTDPEGVRLAVREFAWHELSNYQYVFVLHTDNDHPHVHLSIRTLGLDERKLDPRKDDLQVWREVFAEKLREQGIEAQATYRPTRGIVQKSLGMAQYKAKNWQPENNKSQVGKEKKRESIDRVGIRSLPQEVFRAMMERDIDTYGKFVELLKTYGTVERRDAGRLTEHMSVKPLGANRAALLKDFIFTPAFIELDAHAKRQVLVARRITKKGLNYGEFVAEPGVAKNRASVDFQAQPEGRRSEQDSAVTTAYPRHVIASFSTAPVTARSERDHHTYVARVQDAARALAGESVEWQSGGHKKLDPWGEQEQIRIGWRKIATDLRAMGNREDIALASDVDDFVDRMPPIRTQQQEIAVKLLDIRRSRRTPQDAQVANAVQPPQGVPEKGVALSTQVEVDHGSFQAQSERDR